MTSGFYSFKIKKNALEKKHIDKVKEIKSTLLKSKGKININNQYRII